MEQDRKYLLQKIAEAIYPELNILSDKKGLGDLECRAFEDMELSFYVNDGCGEKLYILEKIQQILGESGIDMVEIAFANYKRDAKFQIYEKKFCIEGIDLEIAVLYCNLSVGCILTRKELRDELYKVLPGRYIVAAILRECIVMVKENGQMDEEYLAKIRETVVDGAGSECLSKRYFKLEDGKMSTVLTEGDE